MTQTRAASATKRMSPSVEPRPLFPLSTKSIKGFEGTVNYFPLPVKERKTAPEREF